MRSDYKNYLTGTTGLSEEEAQATIDSITELYAMLGVVPSAAPEKKVNIYMDDVYIEKAAQ